MGATLEAGAGRGAVTEARGLWCWVQVAVAAGAMVATLPGRTHGLGLITEPLLRDLHLDRVTYASINLWATLLGAAFCLPCGWLIDRLGTRPVLTGVLVGLGGVVLTMSRVGVGTATALFVLVLLTRGLGQSALSVVSLALVGRAAGSRAGPVMGVYSFLTALGFMAAFGLVKYVLERYDTDWRTLWGGMGLVLIGLAPVAWVLCRSRGTGGTPAPEAAGPLQARTGATLGQALRSPAFWVFATATSFYGLIAAGVSLFNQSILEERHFGRDVFLSITALMPLVGLAGNLATGWLAARRRLGRLLAAAMLLLTLALLAFPFVRTLPQVYLYAVVTGVAGGMITVLFFTVWGQAYGTLHLGKIQGAAQMLTVFASAAGPLLLVVGKDWTGSYVPPFRWAALVCGVLALAAWFVRVPRPLPQSSAE